MSFFYKSFFLSLVFFLFGIISCIHSKREVYIKKRSFLNQVIRDVPFFPFNEERFRLSELRDTKATVIAMRDVACPASKQLGTTLARLEENSRKKGVKFIYNYVGRDNMEKNSLEDLKQFGFKGAYVIDYKRKLIDALGVESSAEVFVLNKERRLVYRGPAGKVKGILENLLSGGEIVSKKEPVALCSIFHPVIKENVFYEDVASVVLRKCSICHNPKGVGPMDFVSYGDISGRGKMFNYVIENDFMPPWQLDPGTGPWRNDLSLTVMEKALLLKWANTGFKRKNKNKDMLSALWGEYRSKKQENDFDYKVKLPETVEISKGAKPKMFSDYKTFIIPTNFKEDKWIKGIKAVLKPKIIHHIVFFIMKPHLSEKDLLKITMNYDEIVKNSGNFFVIGNDTATFSINNVYNKFKEAGALLPRGAKIVLVVHYENQGKAIFDNYTHFNLTFYKKPPKYKIIHWVLTRRSINIPRYESSYKTIMSYKLKKSRVFIAYGPHMHYRGKASSMFVIDPEGIKRKFFSVDPYNIKLTGLYRLKKPVELKKGSVLKCINWFDNSAGNPQNPNPSQFVRYGVSETDEMSQCYFLFIEPIDSIFKSHFLAI